VLGVAQAIARRSIRAGNSSPAIWHSADPRNTSRGPVSEGAGMSTPFRVEHATRSSQVGVAVLTWASSCWRRRRSGAGATICGCWPRSTPTSRWRACGICCGLCGLVSVGQQAYVGPAPMCCSAPASSAVVHPLAAIPLAGIVGAVVAVPVAALMFRLRGHYFAIGTWVVAEVFRLLASQISVLGGGSGISLRPASSSRWRRAGSCASS